LSLEENCSAGRLKWDNQIVKDRNTPLPHPGPFRVARVNGEFGAIIAAAGIVLLGVVGLDLGPGFLLGATITGIGVAFLLYRAHKKPLFPGRFF
jgi:hypothetical protein